MTSYYQLDLIKNIQEFKKKPALVTAKIYHKAKCDEEHFRRFYILLVHWIDLLSEIKNFLEDVLVDVKFSDLCELADNLSMLANKLNIQKDDYSVRSSKILYTFRTQSSLLNYQDISNYLEHLPNSPKVLISKSFYSLHQNNITEIYTHLLAATSSQNIILTRSILFSFDVTQILALKAKLVEGVHSLVLHCSCNTGLRNIAFTASLTNLVKKYASSEKLQETSFIEDEKISNLVPMETNSLQVCNIHRIISDLDDVIQTLKSRDINTTPIILEHIKAGRFVHAYYVSLTDSNTTDRVKLSVISDIEKTKLQTIQQQHTKLKSIQQQHTRLQSIQQ